MEEAKRNRQCQANIKRNLRCVVLVRHGDRTPKQKLKVSMTELQILKYFHDHG
jgi:flagellar biosynthesis/type III secretory pathway ATPase